MLCTPHPVLGMPIFQLDKRQEEKLWGRRVTCAEYLPLAPPGLLPTPLRCSVPRRLSWEDGMERLPGSPTSRDPQSGRCLRREARPCVLLIPLWGSLQAGRVPPKVARVRCPHPPAFSVSSSRDLRPKGGNSIAHDLLAPKGHTIPCNCPSPSPHLCKWSLYETFLRYHNACVTHCFLLVP